MARTVDIEAEALARKLRKNIKGEVRLEPESLKFSNMTEERFGELYQAVINVLLRKVFNGTHCPKWSEEELRSVAEQILDFS